MTLIPETKTVYDTAEAKMKGALRALDDEFHTVRTGRANPGLVDQVEVEAYGQAMPINQMANITTPDARTIQISPWDKSQLAGIERAIIAANLGFNPNNDGVAIRINIPALTEERRKELCKVAAHMAEEARVAVRHVRKHANDDVKKLEKDHAIGEDAGRDAHDEIQTLTNDYIKKIDEKLKGKEAEIMEV
ncbi:ribosome recycling factor [bacterium]|nr:ribosome recycling factor [bacterium]